MNKRIFGITNDTASEILIGLEPEGDTVSLTQGKTCVIQLAVSLREVEIGIVLSEGLLSVYAMCDKSVSVEPAGQS